MCIFGSNFFHTLKRVLESMLEATEIGFITFQTDRDHPILFRAMDALHVTQHSTLVRKEAFESVRIPSETSVHFEIRKLQSYVWKCKKSKRLKLSIDSTSTLFVHELQSQDPPVRIRNVIDSTPYLPFNESPGDASFTMSSSELAVILLDMTVGGSTAKVTVRPESEVVLESMYEAGSNKYVIPRHILNSCECMEFELTSGPFIVKFFKLMYTIAQICLDVLVKVWKSFIVIEMQATDNSIHYQQMIRYYVGPRGVPINS